MAEAMTTLGGGEPTKGKKPTKRPKKKVSRKKPRGIPVSKFGQQTQVDPETGEEINDQSQQVPEEQVDEKEDREDKDDEKDDEKKENKDEGGEEKKDQDEKGGKEQAKEKAENKALDAVGAATGPYGKAITAAIKAGKFLKKHKTPILYAILGLLILIGLIFLAIYIPTALSFAARQAGGTPKVETDLNNPEHVKTIENIEDYAKENGECGKRLEFADPEDLKLIKEARVDYRVLVAIEMLAKENNHIRISHVMHLMSVVPANTIETHSDVENEYVDNLSAHKDGMAFDIVEINCVYEKCACNNQCGCNKIPVKVAWQDRGEMPGIARDAGLDQITELLGLPDGALNGNNPAEIFESTGLAELERIFRVAEGVFENVDNLQEFVQTYGQAEIEKALRLPPGSLKDQNSLSGYASEIGRKRLEQVLKLPYGSLEGSQPADVERNTGKESLEEELNIPRGWLTNKPQDAYNYLKNLDLSANEKKSIEQKLGWPSGTIDSLMTDLKQGDTSGVNSTLIEVGKNVLEQAFGLLGGELDSSGSPSFSSAQGIDQDNRYGLPEGTITAFVSALKNGQSINPSMISVGGRELDDGMNLIQGSILDIINGRKTPAQVLAESEQYGSYSNSYIGSRLGISEEEARLLKNTILSGNKISPTALEIGTEKIEDYFNIEEGTLSSLLSGSVSLEDFMAINGNNIEIRASGLGIPVEALNQLFAGDVSGAAITYGQAEIADTFGIDVEQYLAWVEAGNIEALVQNEVVEVISQVLGIDAGIIGGILMGNINPESLISLGFSMLFGGPLGGIFGGLFGGIFGGGCSTSCYQPEARSNIHNTIGQLLDLGKTDENLKPSQIITYRQSDVASYESVVDELYGDPRPINLGLFQRDEMRGHIHVGY